jgi:hypothetical protein
MPRYKRNDGQKRVSDYGAEKTGPMPLSMATRR